MSKFGINLFNASRELSTNVSNYMGDVVVRGIYNTRCNAIVKETKATIDSLEKMTAIDEDAKLKTIESLYTKIEKEKKNCKETIDSLISYKYTEADNKLYKAYSEAFKKDSDDEKNAGVVSAIRVWFKGYNLVIDNTKFESIILSAIAGERAQSFSALAKNDFTTWTTARTKNDFLKVFFMKLCELMIDAGTIKKASLPADVVELVCPKKKTTTKKDESIVIEAPAK